MRGFLNFSLELASKTSISWQTSSTFQGTSFQNEQVVRGFLNFWSNEASKTSISCEASSTFQARSFQSHAPATHNAKMTSHLKVWSAKTSISCETSFKFHTFNLKIDDFVRVFLIKPFVQSSKSMTFAKLPPLFKTLTKCCACHDIWKSVTYCASLPVRFVETAPSLRHKLPRHRERPHHKVLRLPRKNDALALTRFQSIAPVTQNTKWTSHFVTWERQNEHFVRDFLHFSYFEGQDGVAVRVYCPMERN